MMNFDANSNDSMHRKHKAKKRIRTSDTRELMQTKPSGLRMRTIRLVTDDAFSEVAHKVGVSKAVIQ